MVLVLVLVLDPDCDTQQLTTASNLSQIPFPPHMLPCFIYGRVRGRGAGIYWYIHNIKLKLEEYNTLFCAD